MSASQLEPVTPRSHAALLRFKLRSSCDACGQAKIKCDRGQPSCARCISQGASCVYGVSRKAGKPPRRRPAAPSPAPSRAGDDGDMRSFDLAGGDGQDGIDMMLNLADGAMPIDPESPFSASDAAFQTWFPFEALGGQDALTPLSFDQDTCMSGQSGLATTPVEWPHCTQESKDIMRRLYCANPTAPVSDGVPARALDLDTVLTRNRDVIGRLGLLLRCPCARSAHTAMLYASIVSRVLLWYQQVTSDTSPASLSLMSSSSPKRAAEQMMPSLLSSGSLKTLDAGAVDDNRAISVVPTPIMVGSFQSDDRGLQTALTNCLLLSELRKVGDFIDSFVSLGTSTGTCDLQIAGNACPAAGEFNATVADASLFASLGAWLRMEHTRIVRKVRSGLHQLDETLSF